MNLNGKLSQWTISRKICGGKVEVELLTYRPAMTGFTIERLQAAYGDLEDRTAMYALAVPATMGLTVFDDFLAEPEMARLADYWQARHTNPVEDFKQFLLLVDENIIIEWFTAYNDIAQTFLAEETDDPEAESVASED